MHQNTFVALFVAGLVPLAAPQTIDPSTVDQSTKDTWCTNQKSSCPLLCLQIPGASSTPESNTCDATSLAYSCVCSNGQQPNASQYSQTIPYYECTQAATNCVNNCSPSDSSCQSACRSDHPCGAQDPIRVNTSTMSTMASTTTGGAGASSTADTTANGQNTFTGFGGSSPTGTSKSSAVALGFGRTYGLATVLVGVCGGFILLL
ncbi:hypothetical protein N7G274_005889 [Stereocaulon virgatum]|uniref:DUF7707 domain-containing protein n=1 Tax=Stereocaulon virgatum TaxID=373712 RepID=A0ABR4AAK9_9LECA